VVGAAHTDAHIANVDARVDAALNAGSDHDAGQLIIVCQRILDGSPVPELKLLPI
jgi:hypothetical protein